jgi:hypothetical protein
VETVDVDLNAMSTDTELVVLEIQFAARRAARERISPAEATRLTGLIDRLLLVALANVDADTAAVLDEPPHALTGAHPSLQTQHDMIQRVSCLLRQKHAQTASQMKQAFSEATVEPLLERIADATFLAARELVARELVA